MRLIFVYNANSGKVNSIIDSVHKIVSPSTYSCALCAITFGNFRENKVWKNFRERSETDLEFYHKDEFQRLFKSKWLAKFEFPIILASKNEELQIFMTKEELKKLENVESLLNEIKRRQSDY